MGKINVMKSVKTFVLFLICLATQFDLLGQISDAYTYNEVITPESLLACGDHFQITTDPSMINTPSIYEDYVAWGNIFGQIFLYKISTNETTTLHSTVGNFNSDAFFKLNRLFYSSDEIGIKAYDLATGVTKDLYQGGFVIPEVDNDVMAWVEKASGTNWTEVFYKTTFGSDAPTRLSTNDVQDVGVSVYDPYITWVESGNFTKLWLYNTETQVKEVIDSFQIQGSAFLVSPKVFEHGLYYIKEDVDNREIWFYDFANPEPATQLTNTSTGNHFLSNVSESNIVVRTEGFLKILDVSDNSLSTIPNSQNAGQIEMLDGEIIWSVELAGNNFDLYTHNIESNTTQPFLTTSASEHHGAISRDYIVYAIGDLVNDHIFIASTNDLQVELVELLPEYDNQKNGAIDINIRGSIGGLTFSWEGPSGFTANTEDISNLEFGEYILTVNDGNGCTGTTTYIVEGLVNTEEIKPSTVYELFPNPVSKVLNVKINSPVQKSVDRYRLFNSSGQLQLEVHLDFQNNLTIDCSHLPQGLYFLELVSENKSETIRFIKQ